MPENTVAILFRTEAELQGAEQVARSLEVQIGKLKALGQESAAAEAQLARLQAAMRVSRERQAGGAPEDIAARLSKSFADKTAAADTARANALFAAKTQEAEAARLAAAAMEKEALAAVEAAAAQEAAASVVRRSLGDYQRLLGETEKLTGAKKGLTRALKALTFEFPLLGNAMIALLNPWTAVVAVITGGIAAWRSAMAKLQEQIERDTALDHFLERMRSARLAQVELSIAAREFTARLQDLAGQGDTAADKLGKINDALRTMQRLQDELEDAELALARAQIEARPDLTDADKTRLKRDAARDAEERKAARERQQQQLELGGLLREQQQAEKRQAELAPQVEAQRARVQQAREAALEPVEAARRAREAFETEGGEARRLQLRRDELRALQERMGARAVLFETTGGIQRRFKVNEELARIEGRLAELAGLRDREVARAQEAEAALRREQAALDKLEKATGEAAEAAAQFARQYREMADKLTRETPLREQIRATQRAAEDQRAETSAYETEVRALTRQKEEDRKRRLDDAKHAAAAAGLPAPTEESLFAGQPSPEAQARAEIARRTPAPPPAPPARPRTFADLTPDQQQRALEKLIAQAEKKLVVLEAAEARATAPLAEGEDPARRMSLQEITRRQSAAARQRLADLKQSYAQLFAPPTLHPESAPDTRSPIERLLDERFLPGPPAHPRPTPAPESAPAAAPQSPRAAPAAPPPVTRIEPDTRAIEAMGRQTTYAVAEMRDAFLAALQSVGAELRSVRHDLQIVNSRLRVSRV